MRVAFYAPLKSPAHDTVSGDREVARLLVHAMERAGHDVWLASRFRSREGDGDRRRQQRLRRAGEQLARRTVRRLRAMSPADRPAIWVTYHPYHKAPDWIGPAVSTALDIPYVAVEASHAPRQAHGPWAEGHEATARALRQARAVVAMSSDDLVCLEPLLGAQRLHWLPPFLDPGEFVTRRPREGLRAHLAREHRLDGAATWVLVVAMMRPGAKASSYRVLAQAVRCLRQRRIELVVAGDGEAAPEVRRWLHNAVAPRVMFTGVVDRERLRAWLAASDLLAWPAVDEAYGMALLEAQAAGLAVVAGADHGVPDVVQHGVTGWLTPPRSAPAFATALSWLVDNAGMRARMGASARMRVRGRHDLATAARELDRILQAAQEASP